MESMKTNDAPNGGQAEVGSQIAAVVADDSPRFLRAVRRKLEAQGDIKVLAAVKNGAEAVRETTLRHPAMVLLDVYMPAMGGPEAAAIIHAECPEVCVVLMGSAELDEVEERCDESGATAFILKRDLLERISRDTDASEAKTKRWIPRQSPSAAKGRSRRQRTNSCK
jgi:DNA-binding NarL/FixJ family response regulator